MIHFDSIGQFLQPYGDIPASGLQSVTGNVPGKFYLHLDVEAPDHVDLSQGDRGVGQLVHWNVLLILSRVQPLRHLDDLRALFQLHRRRKSEYQDLRWRSIAISISTGVVMIGACAALPALGQCAPKLCGRRGMRSDWRARWLVFAIWMHFQSRKKLTA